MSIQGREEKSAPSCRREGEKRALALLFICFFPSPWPVLCKLGLGRSTVLPEALTPVLQPSFVLFSQAFPFQVF